MMREVQKLLILETSSRGSYCGCVCMEGSRVGVQPGNIPATQGSRKIEPSETKPSVNNDRHHPHRPEFTEPVASCQATC